MKVPKARKLKSGTWFIQLRLGGESVPISAATEKECTRKAALAKAEYQAGKRAGKDKETPDQKPLTLGDAIDAYIDNRSDILSPATIRGYMTIRKYRFAALMDVPVAELTAEICQSACNNESRICSAKTLKNAWGLVSSVISNETGKSPIRVKLPQVVRADKKFLEPEQIPDFIDAVHGTDVEIPALLALSSLRLSEILALRWENINLKKGLIKVKGAAVLNSDNQLVQKKENKNTSSNRIVPIMIPELKSALTNAKQKEGLVVSCKPSTLHNRINRVCAKDGLPLVGVHGLRHSFASLAYHLNIPEKIAMEIGGWSDYQTMRTIYTHIAKSDIKKYIGKLEDFLRAEIHNSARVKIGPCFRFPLAFLLAFSIRETLISSDNFK